MDLLEQNEQRFKSKLSVNIFEGPTSSDDDSERSESISEPSKPFLLGGASQITESLFLSSASAVFPSLLDAFGITCIINVAAELPDSPLHDDSIAYYKINVQDNTNSDLAPYFDQTALIIHNVAQSGGKTLVHCVAGVSRSASICLAYLMKYHNLSLLEAYKKTKTKRPCIKPNCGFFKQLMDYENSLFESNSVKMVFNQFLNMEIPDVYDAEYRHLTSYRKKGRRCVVRYT